MKITVRLIVSLLLVAALVAVLFFYQVKAHNIYRWAGNLISSLVRLRLSDQTNGKSDRE